MTGLALKGIHEIARQSLFAQARLLDKVVRERLDYVELTKPGFQIRSRELLDFALLLARQKQPSFKP